MEDQEEEMKFVAEGLRAANKHRLITEVVYFALEGMKANPELSIRQAMVEALSELDL